MRGFLTTLMLSICMLMAVPASALKLTPMGGDQLVIELTTTADNRDAAVEKAKLEAVLASVGRIFLGDQLILADDLLEKYLSNYGPNFVNAVEVMNEQYVQGKNEVTAKVFVDFAKMKTDLEEKKFLYKPAYKPRFTVFLTERQDGRIMNEGVAREKLSVALNNLGMRRYGGEINTPPPTTDVSAESFLLDAAVVSCQRSGVEVIVTGEVTTNLKDQKKLYFDNYWFYETEMTIRVLRVDTQEVLFEAKSKGTASDRDPELAINASLERASNDVADILVPEFDSFWPLVVQRKADYEILFTGADEELMSIIIQNFKRLGRETEVFVRKSFDRSTVISLIYKGSKQDVLENIGSCPFPTLYVVNPETDGLTFEVQVSS